MSLVCETSTDNRTRTLGRWTTFMERKFWLQYLYNQIQDKSRIRPNCRVVSYTESEHGVEVTTDQGDILTGDVLIGADGIHSSVRRLLADKMEPTDDPAAAREMREGFASTYHCIFATSVNDINAHRLTEPEPFLAPGEVHNVYYRGFSGVAAAGSPGLVFWFLFVKSESVAPTPDTPRFSEDEMDATISKYGDNKLGPNYTFRDLWESRQKAAMVPLEEGVLKTKWHSGGRVVLVGDSVHKATVNPGLGGNLAVEGVVHLVNQLVPLVRRCAAEEKRTPSKEELVAVFDKYEKKQRPHGDLIVSMSGYITRYEAMETWWLRLLLRISPWISDRVKAKGFVNYMKEGPWLSFLPNPDEKDIRDTSNKK
jgi:2-polyprenyl-6-methoxyphenol hydroxylase-like FAD-dependent oxidoreductase